MHRPHFDPTPPDAIKFPTLDLRAFAILLDVDGTLLELAPTPLEVTVPHSLGPTLTRLRERTDGALAFVSGRSINDLDRLFSPLALTAVGGHGAEVRTPSGARIKPVGILDQDVKDRFATIADADPRILVEDKGYSMAIHYRQAPAMESFVWHAAEAIRATLRTNSIELLAGKSMVEIKQAGFSKGSGVRELMAHPPFAGRRPVFIGDDVTDEDAFAIMPEFDGIAISVGRRVDHAAYCIEQPSYVREWLEQISRHGAFAAP